MLFSKRIYFAVLFLFSILFSIPVFAGVTPQEIQGYIAHADPAKALQLLGPILKNDPHSAKAWYLQAEALDAQGHTANAKAALLTAEHLSPAMSFANPVDLKRLEQRIGVHNVANARSTSHLLVIVGLVAMVLLGILGVFMFTWFKRNAQLAADTEKRRSDILIAITTFIDENLKRALISANASDDSIKVAAIQRWNTSLLNAARLLKDVESASQEAKIKVINSAESVLSDCRNALNGNDYADHSQNNSAQPRDTLFGNTQGGRVATEDYSYRPSGFPQTQPPASYGSGNGAGGGFVGALEQGFGMGIGLSVAEDIMDGALGGNDSFSNNQGGFGTDGFGSGNNDTFGSGSGDSFGGTDNGLSSGSDSFGDTDNGLTDDSSGTDDGLGSSDSDDDSW